MVTMLNSGLTTASPTKFQHLGFGLGQRRLPVLEQYTAPDGVRFYNTPTGEKYPSVTTVLSLLGRENIAKWRARVGAENATTIARVAASRGTGVHNRIENYLNNVNDIQPPTPLVQEMFGSIRPDLDRINNIHCQETRMFSHHLRMAGTVDCIGEYDGRLSVIDFKTSTKPKREEWIHSYFMQCAAYAIMYEELTFIPITQLVVLVAVEEDCTVQVFKQHRDNWAKPLLKVREQYEMETRPLTPMAI
jgi:genome maintenance exonuclease 1